MSFTARNVDFDPQAPLTKWPYEALVAAIERGTITDWVKITREIAADPWGSVARQVEKYLSYEKPYGVGPLLHRAIVRARRDAETHERESIAARVRELQTQSAMSAATFARSIGTSRSRLSTYRNGSVTPSATLILRMEKVATRHGNADSD